MVAAAGAKDVPSGAWLSQGRGAESRKWCWDGSLSPSPGGNGSPQLSKRDTVLWLPFRNVSPGHNETDIRCTPHNWQKRRRRVDRGLHYPSAAAEFCCQFDEAAAVSRAAGIAFAEWLARGAESPTTCEAKE